MTRWALLLRAVNVGGRNKLPMAELRRVLAGLGHEDVRTYLNSGNATFTSSVEDGPRLAKEVEQALSEELGLLVRAAVLSTAQVEVLVAGVPADLTGYVLVSVLMGAPEPAKVAALEAWEPEVVRAGAGALYLGYERGAMGTSRLTTALIEKRLGVATTARTPATLQKLLG